MDSVKWLLFLSSVAQFILYLLEKITCGLLLWANSIPRSCHKKEIQRCIRSVPALRPNFEQNIQIDVTESALSTFAFVKSDSNSIFCKFHPLPFKKRLEMNKFQGFKNEIYFYRNIQDFPLQHPRAFYSRLFIGGQHILILEDISLVKLQNITQGCCIEDAMKIVKVISVLPPLLIIVAIAQMHAFYWVQSPQNTSLPKWLPSTTDRQYRIIQSFVFNSWAKFVAVASKLGQPIPQCLKDFDQSYFRLLPSIMENAAQYPSTLIHGNFTLENLFIPERGENDNKFGLFDFQKTRRGKGATDLAFFLATSLDIELRRKHFEKLLCTYYSEFRLIVSKRMDLEEQSRFTYSLAQLWSDVALGLLEGLPFLIHSTLNDLSQSQCDTLRCTISRFMAMLQDMGPNQCLNIARARQYTINQNKSSLAGKLLNIACCKRKK